MKLLKTIALLILVGYSFISCTNSSDPTPPKPTPSKLPNGLWISKSAKKPCIAWLTDAKSTAIIPIENDEYGGFSYPAYLHSNETWSAVSLNYSEHLLFTGHQLITMTETDTIVHERIIENTIFDQPVDSLEDLRYLFADTGIWSVTDNIQNIVGQAMADPQIDSTEDLSYLFETANSWEAIDGPQIILFNAPLTSEALNKESQSFIKEALVVRIDTLQHPSPYRQSMRFYFYGGILCFSSQDYMGNIQRYAIVEVKLNQWTLRSLTPPYPTVVWERLDQLPVPLQKLLYPDE